MTILAYIGRSASHCRFWKSACLEFNSPRWHLWL